MTGSCQFNPMVSSEAMARPSNDPGTRLLIDLGSRKMLAMTTPAVSMVCQLMA